MGSDPSKAHLPAILCLHGGGSNSTVFRVQTRRLYWRLSDRFNFIFPQGPTVGPPGFDMIPTFARLEPFYRWVSRGFKNGESAEERTPMDEVEQVDKIVSEAMEGNGGKENLVGVIGFSQGARLAAGMILRQQLEVKEYGSSEWKFKFGVIIGGPYPPIGLVPDSVELDYSVMDQIPTVHAWGRSDHVRQGCREMANTCDGPNTFVMDFEGGHHLPLTDHEADELCGLIVEAWHAGGGTDYKGSNSNGMKTIS